MTGVYEQFDRHSTWRREVGSRLKVLADWLKAAKLLNASAEDRVRRLIAQVRSDKVVVAFVAEFSRGKSELINALFFSSYGRRIMPASAGRTTMCPTELGYDPNLPACLRLLPIQTHLQPQSLQEWRMVPEKWMHVDLDVDDPEQLANAMASVSETVSVSKDQARALGFWHDDRPKDNPPLNAHGRVEVPRWRHALINLDHPLLKQGLVVLDTPGLNAIGAEPELTVNLIPQAHVLVFVLAADTGVTKSDMAIWRDHLAPMDEGPGIRLAVLNKIDTLWDGLSTPAEIEHQIERQRYQVAQTLSLEPSRVLALSAQKGLLAKVRSDTALLAESRLLAFEQILGRDLLGARQRLLEQAIFAGVDELQLQAQRMLGVRRRELFEQMQELRGMRGKNQNVIRQMRERVEKEKADFERGSAGVLAVHSVHTKLVRSMFKALDNPSVQKAMEGLMASLKESGFKLGIKKAYAQGFANLRAMLDAATKSGAEIESMMGGTFQQLNSRYGLSLQLTPPPDLSRFQDELSAIERSHVQYLGIGNIFRLSRPEFAERLARALMMRVQSVFMTALGEADLWNASLASQLDSQWRERRLSFGRRMEVIERAQGASGGLDQRLAEIDQREIAINALDIRLAKLASEVRQVRPDRARGAAPETVSA